MALIYAWKQGGNHGLANIFKRVFDFKRSKRWAVILSFSCLPVVAILTYITMALLSFSLPTIITIPYKQIPLMIILYFIGAIPEEFGWTYTLTEPLSKLYGATKAGIIIGAVWGIWHILPWSWEHPAGWIIGMLLLDILMRIAMVYVYIYGGKSLFTSLTFHTMINVAMSVFPNNGSYMNSWIFSARMTVIMIVVICKTIGIKITL